MREGVGDRSHLDPHRLVAPQTRQAPRRKSHSLPCLGVAQTPPNTQNC